MTAFIMVLRIGEYLLPTTFPKRIIIFASKYQNNNTQKREVVPHYDISTVAIGLLFKIVSIS